MFSIGVEEIQWIFEEQAQEWFETETCPEIGRLLQGIS